MQGLQLTGYGAPADVVKLVDLPDVGLPASDEIIIDVEASPIEPTDQYIIAGVYGVLPALPHFLGCQGVGRVTAVGHRVRHVKIGDRTILPPFGHAWVSRVKTNATWLRPLPDGDVNQLASLAINPVTAYLILTEFVTLNRGEWVIHNGANSSVGRAVIPIAKSMGLKTVNIVRRPELLAEMTALGGEVALVDGPDLPQRIAEATGNAQIRLALDCVGSASTQRLLESIVRYGTVVIYSSMGGTPSPINTIHLIFNGQSIHGFWIYNWLQIPGNQEKFGAICEKLAPLITSGGLSTPVVGEFALDQYVEALALAAQYSGKVIFTPNR
jgi:mitochondrial enoyl-[acyl-carrier protein] reductase / trans-2-enoyl-CoA reductase